MTQRTDLHGRKVIYTDVDLITESNVVAVLEKAMNTHRTNSGDIEYLYKYYKGEQPILTRKKDVRPEINNKIVANRANEIVSFKVGYSFATPLQYVTRGEDTAISEALNILNEYMYCDDKAEKDRKLGTWMHIAGTGYRMVLPNKMEDSEDVPFKTYVLDPRYSFVVYHSGLGHKRVMGVKYVTLEDARVLYSVYTSNWYYEILDGKIVKSEPHYLGDVPVIEYPCNDARLGAFEIVLPLLDAINTVTSDRLNGVEQFIQALLLLKGVDIDSEDFKKLREEGGLKIPVEGDAEYLMAELNQTQTQTLVDDLYDEVLTICGMPNRNGGSSTSDTGHAVLLRDGWSSAEARAKDVELIFNASEKEFLRIVLVLVNTLRDMSLKLSNIDIRSPRKNYENIQTKAQVLTTMLANDKIHPKLAFEYCGMFVDPELAYTESAKYAEEREAELLKSLEEQPHIDEESEEKVKEDV